jgi:hypothetical protein
MAHEVSNQDDIIASRDIIARIEELTDLESAVEEAKAAMDEIDMAADDAEAQESEAEKCLADAEDDFDDDAREELKILRELAECGDGYCEDWPHGTTLIRESYFVDYCRDLVSDIGDLSKDILGYLVIDWDATADNLRADYTECEWDGVTYLFR